MSDDEGHSSGMEDVEYSAPAPPAPPTLEELKEKGNECFKEGSVRSAIDWWTKAIEVDDTVVALYTNRAMAYNKVGRCQEAIQDCHKALELNPGMTKAYLRLGRAYWMLCDFDAAAKHYEEVLKLEKNNNDARDDLAGLKADKKHLETAKTCMAAFEHRQAKMWLNKILEHCYGNREITIMKARCNIHTEPEIAARDLRGILTSNPNVCPHPHPLIPTTPPPPPPTRTRKPSSSVERQ